MKGRICIRCNKYKDSNSFWLNKKSGKLRGTCKECSKLPNPKFIICQDCKKRVKKNNYNNKKFCDICMKKRDLESKYKHRKKNRYTPKMKQRHLANSKAERKVKIPEGQLCEMCNTNLAIERHHKDYFKPLEVQFLCRDCHNKLKPKKYNKIPQDDNHTQELISLGRGVITPVSNSKTDLEKSKQKDWKKDIPQDDEELEDYVGDKIEQIIDAIPQDDKVCNVCNVCNNCGFIPQNDNNPQKLIRNKGNTSPMPPSCEANSLKSDTEESSQPADIKKPSEKAFPNPNSGGDLEKSKQDIISWFNDLRAKIDGGYSYNWKDERERLNNLIGKTISLANDRCLSVIANAKKELKYYSIPAIILDDITEKISGGLDGNN